MDRYGYAIHTKDGVVEWIPPKCTKVLVYFGPDNLPIVYHDKKTGIVCREGVPEGEGTPNPTLEHYCHNKYKIDLMALALIKQFTTKE